MLRLAGMRLPWRVLRRDCGGRAGTATSGRAARGLRTLQVAGGIRSACTPIGARPESRVLVGLDSCRSCSGSGSGCSEATGEAERSVELYRSPGAELVGRLKLVSLSASALSVVFLPVAAVFAPAAAVGVAGKVVLTGAVATVAVTTTALLTLVTKPYVHSIRCSVADARLLDAAAAATAQASSGPGKSQPPPLPPPDVTLELWTFSMLGRLRSTTVRVSELLWPEAMIGFASFTAGGRDFFVHEYVVAEDPRLSAVFPKLAGGGSTGATPAVMAATAGLEDELAMLIKLGADLDHSTDAEGTPLFAAALHGHLGAVEILLEAGAAVDTPRPADGATPLTAAAHFQHVEVMQRLLDAGAAVDAPRAADGATPLWVAAERGHVAAVEVLLANGADPSAAGPGGVSPHAVALERGHHAVADALKAAAATHQA